MGLHILVADILIVVLVYSESTFLEAVMYEGFLVLLSCLRPLPCIEFGPDSLPSKGLAGFQGPPEPGIPTVWL